MLAQAKFRRYASLEQTQAFVHAVARLAVLADDAPPTPGLTADPGDDYLLALARAANVDVLESGDRHLLALEDSRPPVLTPREFLQQLGDAQEPGSG